MKKSPSAFLALFALVLSLGGCVWYGPHGGGGWHDGGGWHGGGGGWHSGPGPGPGPGPGWH